MVQLPLLLHYMYMCGGISTYLFARVRVDEVLEVLLVAELGLGDQVVELHQAARNHIRLTGDEDSSICDNME